MFRIRAALIAFFCLFSASAAGAGDMTAMLDRIQKLTSDLTKA